MQYPKPLKYGDTVMIIAPAGPPSIEHILQAKQKLEEIGLVVIIGQSVQEKRGYLAGDDAIRVHDLHKAFADPYVKAIFCARGGYGTGRLLSYINYALIRDNPKIFWGYSDITALHIAFGQFSQLVTFHGPMMEEVGKGLDSLSFSFFKQLFHPYSIILEGVEFIHSFSCSITAPLVGGNLAVITSTLGTPYEIDTKNKLLLLEEIAEEPYRIDRMLNQLRLGKKFEQCAGVIFASCHNCTSTKPSLSISDILHDHITSYNIPLLSGLPIGHIKSNIGVPLGVPATINGQQKILSISSGIK
ncbi:LD-carboxypeptidase [Bacillus sp. 3103sda1]|uniref:S66 peptidase family protein n=1 Tax=Bacillus sp. 3103sda1 TaxID=2953808 RepID=UPI0020A0F620|nr:LD-carboxypeptidase [Bacillus sp. 3103sda1]MCP1123030.1 LD-carboxypeptidase [Bacillus sp. 3103sda1]